MTPNCRYGDSPDEWTSRNCTQRRNLWALDSSFLGLDSVKALLVFFAIEGRKKAETWQPISAFQTHVGGAHTSPAFDV